MNFTFKLIPFNSSPRKRLRDDEKIDYVQCSPQEEYNIFKKYIIRSIDILYNSVCQLIHNTVSEQSRHNNSLSLVRHYNRYEKNKDVQKIYDSILEIDEIICDSIKKGYKTTLT